jgi:hypothetical protein
MRLTSATGIIIVLTGLFIGAINWLYDAIAIQAGLLTVYNRHWLTNQSPLRIAAGYAPAFFASYASLYAGFIVAFTHWPANVANLFIAGIWAFLLLLTLPVLVSILVSLIWIGESGLHSYRNDKDLLLQENLVSVP